MGRNFQGWPDITGDLIYQVLSGNLIRFFRSCIRKFHCFFRDLSNFSTYFQIQMTNKVGTFASWKSVKFWCLFFEIVDENPDFFEIRQNGMISGHIGHITGQNQLKISDKTPKNRLIFSDIEVKKLVFGPDKISDTWYNFFVNSW